MGIEEAISNLSERLVAKRAGLVNEEATKTALVLPFFQQVLGYDIFDPDEVLPEYTSDIGLKRGEKVDYAICHNGRVEVIVEVKSVTQPLKWEHASQLIRYYHTTQARIAILTNGRDWAFYTDVDRPNVMDEKPFLTLDLENPSKLAVAELTRMTKSAFDLEAILASAEELKYIDGIKEQFLSDLESPSDELVKMYARPLSATNLTANKLEMFRPLVAKAIKSTIQEKVSSRLAAAMEEALRKDEDEQADAVEIETSDTELQGFYIVRAILLENAKFTRVQPYDRPNFFSIIIDGNKRKTFCRLHFNGKRLAVSFVTAEGWARHPLDSVEDINRYALEIKESFLLVDSGSSISDADDSDGEASIDPCEEPYVGRRAL